LKFFEANFSKNFEKKYVRKISKNFENWVCLVLTLCYQALVVFCKPDWQSCFSCLTMLTLYYPVLFSMTLFAIHNSTGYNTSISLCTNLWLCSAILIGRTVNLPHDVNPLFSTIPCAIYYDPTSPPTQLFLTILITYSLFFLILCFYTKTAGFWGGFSGQQLGCFKNNTWKYIGIGKVGKLFSNQGNPLFWPEPVFFYARVKRGHETWG
jgi:hypothetical protein